jgi:hypothetical protein
MNKRSAIKEINHHGMLLVFPVNNQTEPQSLWSQFYPKSKMVWDWNDEGGERVHALWRLMKDLSDSRQVVYSKWYQGRATFFSRGLFTALLRLRKETALSRQARDILDVLEESSPLSTKEIKKLTDLQGKDNVRLYNRAMKELFSNFSIVGFGEVDDGAFPSLAVGSTRALYEDLWKASQALSKESAQEILNEYMVIGSKFRSFFEKSNTKA